MAKRKRFTKGFKAKVAIEALKGQRSLQELAKEFGVHAQQIGLWKKQLLDSVPEVFGRGVNKELKDKEQELDRAYKQVGQLKVEIDWLKKRLVIEHDGIYKASHG